LEVAPSDVDLVRAFFDAYNARDIETVEEMLDPGVEITTLSARAGLPARWESRANTRRYFEQLDESWAELRVEIHDCKEVGGSLVASGAIRGIGKAREAEVVETFATVLLARGSRFIRIDTYNDRRAAREAAAPRAEEPRRLGPRRAARATRAPRSVRPGGGAPGPGRAGSEC